MENKRDFDIIIKRGLTSTLRNNENIIKAEEKAKTDGLTKLENRMSYMEKAEELSQNGIPESLTFTIADLYKLKKVNDILGHEKGDIYIKSCANALKEVFGKDEDTTIYRFGGDEFVILSLSDTEEQIKEKMKKANELLQANIMKSGMAKEGYHFEINHGTSKPSKEITTLRELYTEADKKLYEDKQISHAKVEGNNINEKKETTLER